MNSQVLLRLDNKLKHLKTEDQTHNERLVWYHVLLDKTASKSNQRWVTKRVPSEKGVSQYDPLIIMQTSCKNSLRIIGPGEAGIEPNEDKKVEYNGANFYEVNMYKFFAEAGYKLQTNWSDVSVVWVDTVDLTGRSRKWVQITNENENLGNQPIWKDEKGCRYVMKESLRTNAWKIPTNTPMLLANMATWYVKSDTNVEEALANRDVIEGMPKYIILTDMKTVLQRRKKQSVIVQSTQDNEFSKKLLYR